MAHAAAGYLDCALLTISIRGNPMSMISGCDVSGKIQFTDPPCDCMAKATIAFDATLYGDCCECECECPSGMTLNGLSGAVNLTSPDGSVTINENGQDIELQVSGIECECSGFEPLIPDPSTVPYQNGRFWPLSAPAEDIGEVVVSGLAPAPGQTTDIAVSLPNLNVVDANFWLVYPGGYTFSMPIPHEGSGLPNNLANGRWTVFYEGDGISVSASKFRVTATSESYDHSNGGVIWGIVRYINI